VEEMIVTGFLASIIVPVEVFRLFPIVIWVISTEVKEFEIINISEPKS